MHQVGRTSIQIDILLSRLCLSGILIAAIARFVKDLVEQPQSAKDDDFHVGIHRCDEHGLRELRTDLLVPVGVEIWVLLVNWDDVQWRRSVGHVGISH